MKKLRKIRVFINKIRGLRGISTNEIRTKLSRFEIFLPVNSARWQKAQVAEAASWHIPDQLSEPLISDFLRDEQTKAKFLLGVAENALGISLLELISDKTVIDIACGPGSIIAELKTFGKKFGLDPAQFPIWVHQRYDSLDFELINAPLESAPLNGYDFGQGPVAVMYNALQHFQNCELAFNNLVSSLGEHKLFFVDYAYVPADSAHPQILTFNRIERLLLKAGYSVNHLAVSKARLPGMVEMVDGQPANILSGVAIFQPPSK